MDTVLAVQPNFRLWLTADSTPVRRIARQCQIDLFESLLWNGMKCTFLSFWDWWFNTKLPRIFIIDINCVVYKQETRQGIRSKNLHTANGGKRNIASKFYWCSRMWANSMMAMTAFNEFVYKHITRARFATIYIKNKFALVTNTPQHHFRDRYYTWTLCRYSWRAHCECVYATKNNANEEERMNVRPL